MKTDEAKKITEKKWVRLDGSCHELKELASTVGLVLDALVKNEANKTEPADIERSIDSLFVVRREMQRIADDIGEIAEVWQESGKTLEE